MRILNTLISLYTLIVTIYIINGFFHYPLLQKCSAAIAPLVEPVLGPIRKGLAQFVPEKYKKINWPPFALLILLILLRIIL